MRTELSWGGGFSSTLLNLRTGEVLNYEQDTARVHSTLGGKCYYTSRTALTGSGFAFLTPDWAVLDAYRTDVCYEQTSWNHPIPLPDGRPLYVFVPLAGHKGLDRTAPVVVTDGEGELHLIRMEGVHRTLLSLAEGGRQTNVVTLDLIDPDTLDSTPTSVKVSIRKERNEEPVRKYLHRFLRLEGFRVNPSRQNLKERYLSLFCAGTGRYYHVNRFYLIDRVWDSDPTLSGTILHGWYREGDLFYRSHPRDASTVEAFVEVPRTSLRSGLDHPDLPTTVEYERYIPRLEWVAKPLQEWEADFKRAALKKAVQDKRHILSGDIQRCLYLLEGADDSTLLTRDASLEVGNCPLGTDKFINTYALPPEGITVGELKRHPRLQEMLQVWDFRKVLISVLDADNAVTEEVVNE